MDRDLFLAAKTGDMKALQRNPRVMNEITFHENNVLHIAAREGHSDVVEWILGVRPCLAFSGNIDKNTPLHEAAKKINNGGVVKALLEYSKCPASRRNQFGETPLFIAAANGHTDAVKLLLHDTPLCMVFWPRNDRQTCLSTAVCGGHIEVVKSILNDRPTCFNILRFILLIQDEFGATPLHAAVHSGHVEIVHEILNISLKFCFMEGWDKSLMTMKDEHGRCAVHIAAMVGNVEIVELFIESKPDCVEIRSKSLKTILHWAVEYNQFEVVNRILRGNDEDVNAKLVSYDSDILGNTALHLAAEKGVDPKLMKYLLSFPGVDLNAMNNKGLTALNIALEGKIEENDKFHEITAILKENNASKRVVVAPPRGSLENIHQNEHEGFKLPDMDTLVASLIATVSFSAIFQVPGGFNDDEGVARLSLTTVFNVFLFSNCLAFFASITVVLAWIFRQRIQTKLILHRSALAKMSMLSLSISVICTGLAFLCATILVTVPRDLENWKSGYDLKLNERQRVQLQREKRRSDVPKYEMIYVGEMATAFAVPLFAVVFLSIAWLIEYYFKANNARQSELSQSSKEF